MKVNPWERRRLRRRKLARVGTPSSPRVIALGIRNTDPINLCLSVVQKIVNYLLKCNCRHSPLSDGPLHAHNSRCAGIAIMHELVAVPCSSSS